MGCSWDLNMNRITIIRPEKDLLETVLSDWASLILWGCRGSTSLTLADMKGSLANRLNIEIEISRSELVLYFGHGTKDKIGHPDSLLDNANIHLCSGKILISIACDTADKLGIDAINSGTKSFIGFDDVLAIYLGHPSLFGSVFTQALLPLLTGSFDVADSRDTIITHFQSLEDHYKNAGANDPNATIIWLAAHINWRGVQAHGDMSARM